MSATATLAHPDRLMIRERPSAPVGDVDLAVAQLAALLAGADGDQMEALEAIGRAAQRLARTRRREVRLEEERPAPMMGSWSLDNGMVNVVLGEN